MTEKQLKLLYDVKLAIDEIESFFQAEPKTYENYRNNILLRRAIERNLEIIGEAMNRILRDEPSFPIENAIRIVGLRNQIIHGYDSVSDQTIWGVVTLHIPKLKTDIEKMIKIQLHPDTDGAMKNLFSPVTQV